MPRKSTGAPTDRPRSDWLKFITTRSGSPSGSRIASPSSEPRRNVMLFGACAPTPWPGGDWNDKPPTITVASDCVFSLKPQSLATVIVGGLSFQSPPGQGVGAQAPNNMTFRLGSDEGDAMREPDGEPLRVVMNFNQ